MGLIAKFGQGKYEKDMQYGLAGEIYRGFNDGEIIWPNLLKLRESDFETIEMDSGSYKYPKCPMLDAYKKFEGEYSEWRKKLTADREKFSTFEKFAAKTTSTGTWPISMDPQIIDQTLRTTPFYAMSQKIVHKYKTYDYDLVTAATAGDWLAENAALTVASDTVSGKSATIKFAYAIGGVSNPALTLNKGYDLMNAETAIRTNQLMRIIEKTWICAKESAAVASDTGTLFYDTNYAQIGVYRSIILSSGNATSHGGTTALVLSVINGSASGALLPTAQSDGNDLNNDIFLTDVTTLGRLKTLLTQYQRITGPTYTFPWGAKTWEVDGIPVIAPTAQISAATKRVFALVDMQAFATVEGLPPTKFDIADTTDADSFAIKYYGASICRNPISNAGRVFLP